MDALTAFGLFAVTFMLVCYMLRGPLSPWWTLAFAGGSVLGSAYGFLQGAWPFGLVELAWTAVAFGKWWRLRRRAAGRPARAASGGTAQPRCGDARRMGCPCRGDGCRVADARRAGRRRLFWFDELWTVWIVRAPSAGELARRIGADVHPPLYYALAWLWTRAFGLSEVALRLPSLIAAVAAVAILVTGLKQYGSTGAAADGGGGDHVVLLARFRGDGADVRVRTVARRRAWRLRDRPRRAWRGRGTAHAAAADRFRRARVSRCAYPYLLLLVGAVFGWTLLWTPRGRDRAVIAGGGLAIVLVMAGISPAG